MSMYLLQVKLSQTVTQSLVLACCALTMVGCNRTPDAKEEKNASATAQTQADNGSAVKCSSEQATSAIHTYLVNRLQQQASSQAQMIEQQASTVVDRSILQNNLNQIAVNLESVNGNQGQCRATVSFNMPQSQLDNADKIYARLRLPVVAQQVVSRGYQLQNSTVVAKNIGFGRGGNGFAILQTLYPQAAHFMVVIRIIQVVFIIGEARVYRNDVHPFFLPQAQPFLIFTVV